MTTMSNECGSRNTFGFYDAKAREIILTRPCTRKVDIQEVYAWLDCADDLRKLAIGIGGVETFVVDDSNQSLYTTARHTIKQSIEQNTAADGLLLKNILIKLQDKTMLRNLSLRCFLFADDLELFDLLLVTIRKLPSLVYLDLTGCYFADEQLIELARVISDTHIANMIWPEPRMSQFVLDQVVRGLSASRALVVTRGVPVEIEKIAQSNRKSVFEIAKRASSLSEKEVLFMKEYKDTFKFTIADEKQRLFELEKNIEGVLA